MKRALALALVLSALATGCAAPASDVHSPARSQEGLAVTMDGRDSPSGIALTWNSTPLVYEPSKEGACAPGNCEVKRFTLAPNVGPARTLQVGLDWSASRAANTGDADTAYPSFNLTLLGPQGLVRYHHGTKFGNVVHVDDPPAGEYRVETRISHFVRDFIVNDDAVPQPTPSTGAFMGSVLVYETPAAAPDPLLPDLIVQALDQLQIAYSPPGEGNMLFPSAGSPATPGCTFDEARESGASRCLRFSIGVGNQGAGPLIISQNFSAGTSGQITDGVPFYTGQKSVPAVQCVADGRGGGQLREAGNATWSTSHEHVHYDHVLGYELFAYDLTTDHRLDRLRTGGKLGYGPASEMMVHAGLAPASDVGLTVPCKNMQAPVGLGAGWGDYYMWWRVSQFIDVAGVPDGVYELVTTFNPEHQILETDYANNAGSVVFRLTGNDVEVVRPFVYAG